MKKIILAVLLLTSFGCTLKPKVVKPPKPVKVKEVDAMEKLKAAPELYTLYNIHVDPKENRVYTMNYQLKGLVIPICSRVVIGDYNKESANFKIASDNRNYIYLSHRAVKEKIGNHLTKVFGPNCNKKEIAKLSKIDQEGIKKGEALPGMTKKGVLYAIGNPPSNVNSPNSNQWLYWRDRWNKFYVVFDEKGVVTAIKG